MFTSGEEILRFIGDEEVQFVDVRFCDLPGTMQHFTVPVESFDEKVFSDGLMFDGSSIRGFQQIHESDMLLLPDATTAVLDPFRARKTLNLTFFVHDPLTGEPYTRDPRNIARKAQDYLRGSGIADTAYFGREAEFYIFDSARFDTSPQAAITTSTRSRARGTPGSMSPAATWPTSRVTRAATSRSRRLTTTRTCAPTWSGLSSTPASWSRCSTTRSARPGSQRSTCGLAACWKWPTT